MSNAIAVIGQKDLLTQEDVAILKRSKFKDFDDGEIAYAVKFSTGVRLNPMLNQIHFVRRRNKDGTYAVTAQVSIDGFRLTAQRTGEYAGSEEAVFEYAEGDKLKKKPTKATVTVYRLVAGQRCSFTASARWDEYYSPVGGMWDRMSHVMLAKCAEAQALRKAFPAELANLYSDEEMAQADRPNKAQEVQSQIQSQKPAEKEVEAEVVSTPAPSTEAGMVCKHCDSTNVMVSRFDADSIYCRDCKKPSPKGGA